MRLICPNCGAQYEVDDSVIPEAGRDVQCSNCGHTWFQRPAHLDAELSEELDQEPAETEAAQDAASETEPAQPKRRGLDPQVADVLREEAQREAAARRAELAGLETQGDLGLDDGSSERTADRTAAARARMARLRGLDDDGSEAAAAAAATGSRRELLPDIEEINSTLRASEDRGAPDGAMAEGGASDEPRRRSGFRLGFGLSMLAVAAVVLLYSFAPQIIKAVPQTEPYLSVYVEWANEMRGRLNSGVDKAVERISTLVGGLTGGDN